MERGLQKEGMGYRKIKGIKGTSCVWRCALGLELGKNRMKWWHKVATY
jgi:hypothetical protein